MKHPLAALLVALITSGPVHAFFNIPVDPTKLVEGATKVTKGATGIGAGEEASIGEAVALEIIAAYGGLWQDSAATRRANLIGRTLGAYSDRPVLLYRVGILDSDALNGFSSPGGWVFITRGAYQAADNDDQLAGIIAHEIAHISRRHALRIISRNETVSGLIDVAAGSSTDFAQFDLGIDKASNTILKFGYDAGTEFEADRVGKWNAFSAGYNKDGLRDFLVKLQSEHSGGGEVFSTHPPLKDRIARLNK
jgi:predicted Zn-dependent protease